MNINRLRVRHREGVRHTGGQDIKVGKPWFDLYSIKRRVYERETRLKT